MVTKVLALWRYQMGCNILGIMVSSVCLTLLLSPERKKARTRPLYVLFKHECEHWRVVIMLAKFKRESFCRTPHSCERSSNSSLIGKTFRLCHSSHFFSSIDITQSVLNILSGLALNPPSPLQNCGALLDLLEALLILPSLNKPTIIIIAAHLPPP